MFSGCKSLSSLPNISVWDSSNFQQFYSIFSGCESLTTLPDLDKWPFSDHKYFGMYYGCLSLSFIPQKKSYGDSLYKQEFDFVNCINGADFNENNED